MKKLGKTSLNVSHFCFGTMTFGREADESTSQALFNRCRDSGINFFDCADTYAGGESERILGRLVKGCRDDVVITSKVGMKEGLAPDVVRQSAEGSLERLGVETIDVYFCHRFDPDVPMADTLEAFSMLRDEGKIRHIGVSNWAAWQIATGLGLCRQRDLAEIDVIQPMYNLAKRTAEIEIFPLARHENLGVITYSPLGGGLLTGKYVRDEAEEGRLKRQKNYAKRYGAEQHAAIARRFTEFAREKDVHPVTLAVAWVARHPVVTTPIIGARNLEQLEPALAALDLELTDDEYRAITDLTPPVPPATDRTEEQD